MSPPGQYSRIKKSFSVVWKAKYSETMKGWSFILVKTFLSACTYLMRSCSG